MLTPHAVRAILVSVSVPLQRFSLRGFFKSFFRESEMYTKMFMGWLGFITACVVFVVGIIHSGAWVVEHPAILLLALLLPVAYYGFAYLAIITDAGSVNFLSLESYVRHGPLKEYALARLQGAINRLSRNTLIFEFELAIKLNSTLMDTLRAMIIRLEEISPSPQDFEKDAISVFQQASGNRRAFIAEYLEPYTKKRIMNAGTTAELNDIMKSGLVSQPLQSYFEARRAELYDSNERRVPRRVGGGVSMM